MANALFESYKGRIAVAEKVFSKAHAGEKMDTARKLMLAKCLDNTARFLNESIDATNATQRADLGDYKRFALNLTNVALPSLIAPDLVLTQPMSSMYGYINYIKYMYGTDKGETKNGTVVNDPFRLGAVDSKYTGAKVVETISDGQTELAWSPVVAGSVEKYTDGAWVKVEGEYTPVAGDKVRYEYDNVVIPQATVPTLRASMETMPLMAKARRIAVYYSQIAAFQAKTDYGFDLGDQLAEKAVGQLTYEIDTEVIELLKDTAGAAVAELTWSKTLPMGVSKSEHYEGFTEIVEIARQVIYDRTKRFAPNYMVIASDVLPVLTFIKGFSAAPASNINGPYFAGTLNALKVYVSPSMAAGEFMVGVNGDDMMSSVAVYAPYMPVVPTSLLQYNDGGTTQGWSTMYDLKVLNKELIVAGKVTA